MPRLAGIDRRERPQGLGQLAAGTARPGARALIVDRALEDALGDQAVLDHVRDARGRAHVVLEHAEHAVGTADEVDAGDRDAHAARRPQPAQLGHEELGAQHEVGGDRRLARRIFCVAVHVVEERAQRGDPLGQPALDPRPLVGGDDARHEADGEDLLGAPLVRVDREGDALVVERQLGQRLVARELVAARARRAVRTARRACGRGAPSASTISS